MKGPLLLITAATFGALILYIWYCEMFSDGFMGSFSRAFNSRRGKNFIALSQPASGLTACFIGISALGTIIDPHAFSRGRHVFPFWEAWTLFWGIPAVLCTFLIFIGFIPFTLPEWMYPEYHELKREEQRRREAAERGEIEDRDPFLDDNGVYISQLDNVPVDIPEAVGLPSTADPCSIQAAPSPGSLPPLQGAPETGAPAFHDPNTAADSDTSTAGVFDITATTTALPRTTPLTSHGARPARARRGTQEGDATPTADNATDEPASTDETEHSSASSEVPPMSPPKPSSAES